MDAKSPFITANADTVYFWSFIDVSKGPIVFEVPPKVRDSGRHVVPLGHGFWPGQDQDTLAPVPSEDGHRQPSDTSALSVRADFPTAQCGPSR